MIWRSVVGKLWLTIIGLVSVVLIVLVLLLIQFLDQFFENENERSLTTLSQELAQMIEDYGSGQSLETRRHVIEMAEELLPAYNTQMVVLTAEENGTSYDYFTTQEESLVPIEQLLKRSDLKEVFEGKEKKVRGTLDVEVEGDGKTEEIPPFKGDVLAVAEPIRSEGDVIGAIVLYQSLSQLEHTTNRTKELVFYAALIGIFLTTFFAFFLSSRVTQPLLKMKQAANEMAEGNFDIRVPARTQHDEIGELAETFNRMGAQLEESIHALSQEKEQLSSVLKSMTDAVITVNADGHVIITNPPADHLLEMWSESGEDQRQLNYQPLPKPLVDSFNQVVETEQEYATDLFVHGRTWAVVMTPLYNRDQVRGAVAVLRDVTEERRMDKLRKDFVANVSHELRTPLAMLQGYSEALVDDIAQSPEDRKELASIIHDETLRMGRLVKELLDLARMESGSTPFKPRRVVVQNLGNRIIRKFHSYAGENGVNLEAAFPDELLYGWLDEDGMEQVLTNLIDNAIRHTPENGTVTLEMDKSSDGGVVIRVRDTGTGIPVQDLPFIFERFYKADKARTRGGAGTGLGLSIAKHIVEEHGGKISVESKEGKGTVFTIHLPDKNGHQTKNNGSHKQ